MKVFLVRTYASLVLLLMCVAPGVGIPLGIWVDWRWAATGIFLGVVGFVLATPFTMPRRR